MAKFKINTYGCQMNVHDSEKIAGVLQSKGYQQTEILEEADIIVFNTCCIRHTAEKRIFGNIGDVKHLKKANKSLIVAVVGCMTQQEGMGEDLKSRFPFIDIILGTSNSLEIGDKVESLMKANTKRQFYAKTADLSAKKVNENEFILRTSYPNAWVTIMYGCDNFCTYCIVPHVRGREQSRNPEKILEECKNLLQEGYKSITFLGQNVNSYSYQVGEEDWNFARLLQAAANLPFDFQLKFMTSHPKDFSDEVIDIIANSKNIAKQIHLPVQAGSNKILQKMNRKYTREKYLSIIQKIREKMPNCVITTDIMVGFPEETEEDFLDTIDLVERVRFDSAFTFVYSQRKGTPAAKLEQIPYTTKKSRIVRLVALQNKITQEKAKNQ